MLHLDPPEGMLFVKADTTGFWNTGPRISRRDNSILAILSVDPPGWYSCGDVWEYARGIWREVLNPGDLPEPGGNYTSIYGFIATSITSDERWSSAFCWVEGSSIPRSGASIAQLIDDEWQVAGEVGKDFIFYPFNDGATWALTLDDFGYTKISRHNWRTGKWHWRRSGLRFALTNSGVALLHSDSGPLSMQKYSFLDGIICSTEISLPFDSQSANVFGPHPFVIMRDMVLCRVIELEDSIAVEPVCAIPEGFPMPYSNLIKTVYDARGNIWLYYPGERHVAIYDRTDELIDPTITLTVGLDVIEPGDTTVINASIAPGQRTYDADVYAVIQTPSGELWSYPWNIGGVHPIAENLHFTPETFISDFILLHIEQPQPLPFGLDGDYMVYVAMMEPGTLNPIGEIATVPFELRLAQ
ncbi:MAG: hypothetical protein JW941_10100 [Candidatus Coatesbacteria bacterium]|nr:hypothetical protein [Candidatus Coatesbacteria bacterium]